MKDMKEYKGEMYPLKLESVYVNTIWGGKRLAKIRNNPASHGTSWDVSAHPHADNIILNGHFHGKRLSEMLDRYPENMLGEKKRSQMLRVSLLDSAEALSIQVHPDDGYAHVNEQDEGKTEAWYILEAVPGANLVAGTTAKNLEELKKAVEADKIEDYIKRHFMEQGDFICIDAGTLHAMGAGMLALEISQNSDVTYRFYDYHRKDEDGKERRLHLEKSYDVVDCTKKCEKTAYPLSRKRVNERIKILDKREFNVEILDLDGEYTLRMDGKKFYCLSNVSGNSEVFCRKDHLSLDYTENLFIPAKCPDVTLKGNGRIIISYVK